MISLINAQRLARKHPSVGFINPALYASNAKGIFHDVVDGHNKCTQHGTCCATGFDCVPGWDPVTGHGSVDHGKFLTYMMQLVDKTYKPPALAT